MRAKQFCRNPSPDDKHFLLNPYYSHSFYHKKCKNRHGALKILTKFISVPRKHLQHYAIFSRPKTCQSCMSNNICRMISCVVADHEFYSRGVIILSTWIRESKYIIYTCLKFVKLKSIKNITKPLYLINFNIIIKQLNQSPIKLHAI